MCISYRGELTIRSWEFKKKLHLFCHLQSSLFKANSLVTISLTFAPSVSTSPFTLEDPEMKQE